MLVGTIAVLATRFSVSSLRSRENRSNHNANPTTDNDQVRLADSVLLFNTGVVSPGVILLTIVRTGPAFA